MLFISLFSRMFVVKLAMPLCKEEESVVEIVRHVEEGWVGLRLVTEGVRSESWRYEELCVIFRNCKHVLRRISRHLLKRPYGPDTPYEVTPTHHVYYKFLGGRPAIEIFRQSRFGHDSSGLPITIVRPGTWAGLRGFQRILLHTLIEICEPDITKNEKDMMLRRLHTRYVPDEYGSVRAKKQYIRRYRL